MFIFNKLYHYPASDQARNLGVRLVFLLLPIKDLQILLVVLLTYLLKPTTFSCMFKITIVLISQYSAINSMTSLHSSDRVPPSWKTFINVPFRQKLIPLAYISRLSMTNFISPTAWFDICLFLPSLFLHTSCIAAPMSRIPALSQATITSSKVVPSFFAWLLIFQVLV